ncbi:hypothetical protein ANTPLA_LOCUS2858 [Anthophora plagiata]
MLKFNNKLLLNLNFNNSSNESSPSTTKIKRRVSFAEKKHVKEFCNSLEQGTVWNNTYEEHDLSNLKISTSDQEQSEVEHFCKETTYSSTQENNVQFIYNEEIEKKFNIEDCSQNIILNKDVNCQDEMLLCAPVSISFNDTVPQEDCIIQNVQQFNKSSTSIITVKNEDTSMELTVNVPSVIEPVDNVETAVYSADDRTEKLDDVFVELTTAVSTTLCNLQSNISKADHYSSNLVTNDDNKSIIFHDDSMDIIDIVEKSAKSLNRITVMQNKPQHEYDTTNHDEKTKLLNVSMEMTEMVPFKVHSVTRSFKRNAVMYDAIMNNSKKLKYNIDTYEISVNSNETRIYRDETMELTKAITASSQVHLNDSQIPKENTPYLQSNLDGTKICSDEEMEFTRAAITVTSEVHQNDSQIPVENTPCLQSNLDETKTCNDEEMEFTRAAITVTSEVHQNDSQIPVENTPCLQSNLDRTRICSDEEMEFTTAITVSSEVHQSDDSQIPVEKIPSSQPNFDRTKICNDEEMEFTTAAITTSSKVHQNNSQIPTGNTPYLQSNLDGTRICNDEEMEFTRAVITASSEVHRNDSQVPEENTPYLQSNLDGTKICSDEEMEITGVVITATSGIHQSNSQIPAENTPCLQSNLDETKMCNDEKMELTTAPITASSEENSHNLQLNLDGTKICNDEEMELTTAPVTASSGEHQNDSQVPEGTPYLHSNLDRTKICNDEEMEFTTAVIVASELHQNDLQIAVEKIPCLQPNLSNSMLETCRNDCANSMSNGTTIFYNNSMTMTKVVSLLNTDVAIDRASDKNNQESSKTMLFPCTSMEVTDAVATAQPNSQADDSTVNSTNIMQSVLSTSFENRDLVIHSSILADKILKDSISLSLNFDRIPGKENFAGINSTKDAESSLVEESAPVEVQSSANIKPSMALHESMQQHACVSALKEDNTEKACVTFNPGNGSFSAVNLQINKSEPMQNPTSASRRTYIIQPLNNDQTLQCSNGENNKILETSRETPFHDLNDDENSTRTITNEQTGDDYNEERSTEKFLTFSNENSENFDLIEPPTFVCLDDVSNTTICTSITCNQEIDMEKNCLSAKENTKPEDCSKSIVNYSNHNSEYNNEETVHKSRTFVIKCRPNEQLETSTLEQEDQEQTNKISELQLVDVKDTNANIKVLECSSSTTSDNEKFVASNGKKDLENLCRDNCYLENQSMEYSSSNIIPIHESTPKVNNGNNDKLISAHVMETDNQSYCNEQIKFTVESDTIRAEENIPIEVDSFSSLMNKLRVCAKSDDIIWEVYHENIERNVFVIGFISCSLLVIIYVRDLCDVTSDWYIKEVKLTSRLAEHAGELLGIIHRVILEKLDGKKLLDLYGTGGDILPMLDHITKEVKLAMDFMFEVKRLNDINLMEITRESVSFVSRTKRMDIILKITMYIKPFDRIEPEDISVHCILGSVKEEDVKMLIKNIKRDHKFLRRYMNDVRDYIYLMEECGGVIEKSD